MHRIAGAVANRLSLRPPQRRSLEILDRITELIGLQKGGNRDAALALLKAEFPDLADFERDFPSVCFALATGAAPRTYLTFRILWRRQTASSC